MRQHRAACFHAVTPDDDARWLPARQSIVVALVLGAAAGTIAGFFSTLAQAGLVLSL